MVQTVNVVDGRQEKRWAYPLITINYLGKIDPQLEEVIRSKGIYIRVGAEMEKSDTSDTMQEESKGEDIERNLHQEIGQRVLGDWAYPTPLSNYPNQPM